MSVRLHGIQDEIKIGDIVETTMGVGEVIRISEPVREIDQAMLEIDLGKKWLNVDQVRSIVKKSPRYPTREEPEADWDEHE
ncbi:MAG: hypothetical protein Kow00129_16840 [Thermoleophilia bacterium]